MLQANRGGVISVEQFSRVDGDCVYFQKVSSLQANQPYLITVPAGTTEVTFEATDTGVQQTIEASSMQAVSGDYAFCCNYLPTEAGEAADWYLLNSNGTGFVRGGSNTRVGSFRGYVKGIGGASPAFFALRREDNSTDLTQPLTSGVQVRPAAGGLLLRADQARSVGIWSVQGQLLRRLVLQPGETYVAMPAGMYVVEGQKAVVYESR